MLTKITSKTHTLEEYRLLEATSEEKHEYHNGEIILITGGTIAHNTIIVNLIFLLKIALCETIYRVQSSDLRLWIPQYQKGLYPDVMIIAGAPVLSEGRTDEILNPCLIIEVLSPSTSGYDRGDKFLYYRSIPEFQEYLLVNQSEYTVEHYIKTGENQWLLREYHGSEAMLNLTTVGVTLAVKEIYEGVNLELTES